jgi:hypothetical protein
LLERDQHKEEDNATGIPPNGNPGWFSVEWRVWRWRQHGTHGLFLECWMGFTDGSRNLDHAFQLIMRHCKRTTTHQMPAFSVLHDGHPFWYND